MSEIAIRAEKLSKRYERYEPRSKLLQRIGLTRKPIGGCGTGRLGTGETPSAEFWALKDVSFEVKRGEVVGVIGRNGAGKSTLLKLLSRITEPTSGRADIYGRVGSLLEVGTGFHPDLTGRENVFLNGALLGMSRADVRRRFDEIVAFAEIEDFIDTPVKHYSSGMYVRLAFSVAAHLEPEILIVDEVLAVGDASFQQKSLKKMQSLVNEDGRTVLLVSHNAVLMSTLCDRALYLETGSSRLFDSIAVALTDYGCGSHDPFAVDRHSWQGDAGGDEARMRRTWLRSLSETLDCDTRSEIEVGVEVEVLQTFDDLILGFWLVSEFGPDIAFALHDDDQPPPVPAISPGRMVRTFRIPGDLLGPGRYRCEFVLGRHMRKSMVKRNAGTLVFSVREAAHFPPRFVMPRQPGLSSILRPKWCN